MRDGHASLHAYTQDACHFFPPMYITDHHLFIHPRSDYKIPVSHVCTVHIQDNVEIPWEEQIVNAQNSAAIKLTNAIYLAIMLPFTIDFAHKNQSHFSTYAVSEKIEHFFKAQPTPVCHEVILVFLARINGN